MSEKQEKFQQGCCEPECGPSTCGTKAKSKRRLINLLIIVGIAILIVAGCAGYLSSRGHRSSAKVASAEMICEEGTVPTASQIDQALANQGFKLVKMEQRADGKIICQISGLKGKCCAPGVETSLKNVPGVKLAKVSW